MPAKSLLKLETLIGFIVIIAGIDLALMASKLSSLVGIAIIPIGVIIVLHSLGIMDLKRLKSLLFPRRIQRENLPNTISRRIIDRATMKGKLLILMQLLGLGIIAFVIIYNLINSPDKGIGSYDTVALLLGSILIIYPMIYNKYPKESDFVLLFFLILSVEVFLAMALLGANPDSMDSITNDAYVRYMLIAPLDAMLRFSGIQAESQGSIINLVTQDGDSISVGIAISCSGIYSAMIFLAAFVAFVLSFYYRWERKTAILLAIGMAATYFANLLRMYLIMLAGYFNGVQPESEPFTLLWTHKYAGELIFICWIALFWWLTFRYFAPDENLPPSKSEKRDEEDLDSVAIDPDDSDAKDF